MFEGVIIMVRKFKKYYGNCGVVIKMVIATKNKVICLLRWRRV